MDEEVLAVILAIIFVVGVFAVAQALFGGEVIEPFSELAILGEEMKIANYPKNLSLGEPFKLHVYIGNREGKIMYYSVVVKLGNRSTLIDERHPMNAPVIMSFDRVLMNGQNYTKPLTLSIDEPGLKRLVFELWVYDETLGRLRYHGRFNQLWLNVT